MKNPHDIIIRPLITEKSTMDTMDGKYTFAVNPQATKTEIRQAVEKLFEVRVLKVHTQNYDGKVKRQGMTSGRRANWKKAIVTIDTDPEAASYMGKGGKETSTGRKYKDSIEEFGFGQ